MAEVGLGQLATTTGRLRSRKLKDSVSDHHPLFQSFKENGGIKRKEGGRSIVEESMTAQNATVEWVGENGQVSLADQPVLDSSEFDWKYILGAVSWTLAEQYKNSGGSDTKLIELVGSKFKVLEKSMKNEVHAGALSAGTGNGGLQLGGLAALVSKTPAMGLVGNINRANPDAAWFRNLAFNTQTDWTEGSVDAGNVKRFLDKGINATTREDGMSPIAIGLLGQLHFEALTQALQAIQMITNESKVGKAGFSKLVYREIPMYFGGGKTFSGNSLVPADTSYLLDTSDGALNLVYHEKAEYAMLEPIQARDSAGIARLMFTMMGMTLGYAGGCWVGFDS